MRLILFMFFLLGNSIDGNCQVTFHKDHRKLILTEIFTPASTVVFDDPIAEKDDYRVGLFKKYFNPGSITAYKSFFLPQDWMNLTSEQYDQWQARIKEKKLHLYQVLHLKEENGQEYLVFQYTMESKELSVPASTEFKKVQGMWRHTSLQNDVEGPLLSRIGDVEPDYYRSALRQKSTDLRFENVQVYPQWKVKEKFDRISLFNTIEELLREMQLEQNDIETAKWLFLQKEHEGFISFISGQKEVDETQLMKSLNEAVGFRLFKFTQTKNE